METTGARLKYLRGELEAERISLVELVELQELRAHSDPGDTFLLEAAGVPEPGSEEDFAEKNAQILKDMEAVSNEFYRRAVVIGCHPFIEFTGLMNEYIKVCAAAHKEGIDFTQCNTHTGKDLPMREHQVDYVNEKLECIFTGRSVMKGEES